MTSFDAARLDLMLTELRMPSTRAIWRQFAERADCEQWPAARLLTCLAEHELAERARRRIERNLGEARLLPGKSIEGFDFSAVPGLSKARVEAIAGSDDWIERGGNLLLFGPPGVGKSHIACAIGLCLVERGFKVLFSRTTDLVQKLLRARNEHGLDTAIARLDKYRLLILDDFAYLRKNEAESGVLFELISARYENRSMILTANQPFGNWVSLFPSESIAVAAVDRLIHHGIILELNAESYRSKAAAMRKEPGRPPSRATARNSGLGKPDDNPDTTADGQPDSP